MNSGTGLTDPWPGCEGETILHVVSPKVNKTTGILTIQLWDELPEVKVVH